MRARLAILAFCALACGTPTPTPPGGPAGDPSRVARADAPATVESASPTRAPPAAAGQAVVLVTDAIALSALEKSGLGAGPMAFGGGDDTIASFSEHPRLKSLRTWIGRDLEKQRDADPKAGVGMRHSHRLFDLDWLSSEKTRLELIGVVNRSDRRPFEPNRCGETRLVYRLAYRSRVGETTVDSRLPMTVNVVFWQDDGARCKEAAGRWIAPAQMSGEALAQWLARDGEGPLTAARLSGSQLKSIEVNLQVLRWPAVVHPSLGGHAEYVLRVFHPDGRGLVPAPLENTPDVDRLRGRPAERAALLAWLRQPATVAALETGTVVMPERYAATEAISVTPLGLGRIANRPFSQLFDAADFEGLELGKGTHVKSPAALLRRLDGLSCQGCHETRSVAGFHLLGEPRDPAKVLDTLFIPTSSHLDGELERRRRWVEALASGAPGDVARPLSDFERVRGGYGAHCGLGDAGFQDWDCADGLHCVAMDDPQMGSCLPELARTAGDPCQHGALRSRPKATSDRVRQTKELACDGDAVCNTSSVGFPAGMCTKSCRGLGQGEACGAIVNLTVFNNCIARRRPFPTCIEAAAVEAGMRECDFDHRCRDDYICARSPSSPQQGVCLPPYFLFQMRVDGHVL